jgi:hypothetical protein
MNTCCKEEAENSVVKAYVVLHNFIRIGHCAVNE